jgi:hypothetical protein
MFAGFAVSGLFAVTAGGVLVAALLLGSERAGAAAGETDDEGEGGEYFHDGGVAVG